MHRVKPLWGPNFRVNYYKETKSSLGLAYHAMLESYFLEVVRQGDGLAIINHTLNERDEDRE